MLSTPLYSIHPRVTHVQLIPHHIHRAHVHTPYHNRDHFLGPCSSRRLCTTDWAKLGAGTGTCASRRTCKSDNIRRAQAMSTWREWIILTTSVLAPLLVYAIISTVVRSRRPSSTFRLTAPVMPSVERPPFFLILRSRRPSSLLFQLRSSRSSSSLSTYLLLHTGEGCKDA